MFSREDKTPLAEWWRTVDRQLLAALMLLLACGIVLSFAASPPVAERLGLSPWHFVLRHAGFALTAFATLIAVSFLPPRWARWAALGTLAVSIVLIWATLRFGTEVKGARRWFSFAGQSVQPSEFVKPAFAVVGAWLCAESMKQQGVPAKTMLLGILGLVVGGLLLQPDLGQSILMVATWAALLFLTGMSWFLIFGLAGLGVAGLFAAYQFFPHVAKRIDGFINPDVAAYQPEKALQSILEGGWFGRGPGESMAKKVIPDAHADFVFSAAAGEFGILFCLMLVGLIGFIVVRALVGAQQQTSLFHRLAISTIAIQFALQSAINLTVNLHLIPPKGMTLPFVSYGGTSMIAIAFGMGLMLALARKKPEERLQSGLPLARVRMVPEPA